MQPCVQKYIASFIPDSWLLGMLNGFNNPIGVIPPISGGGTFITSVVQMFTGDKNVYVFDGQTEAARIGLLHNFEI
jgi:hypothetical protein